jgi:hypothetical protein
MWWKQSWWLNVRYYPILEYSWRDGRPRDTWSDWSMFRPRLEPGTSRIQVRGLTARAYVLSAWRQVRSQWARSLCVPFFNWHCVFESYGRVCLFEVYSAILCRQRNSDKPKPQFSETINYLSREIKYIRLHRYVVKWKRTAKLKRTLLKCNHLKQICNSERNLL